ncbi:MAG: hypothetical protein K9I85_11220 [Saprospiraceae bacterium]|nr:hypothetical protein [Saprospiraceae bacterium]
MRTSPLIAQHLLVQFGTLIEFARFPSRLIDPRSVVVWLPDGYTDQKQYAVLYMHDGQMLFSSTVTKNQDHWGVDSVLQPMLEQGILRDVIVVGIFNHDQWRSMEYLPQRPLQDLTLPDTAILKDHPDPQLPDILNAGFRADSYLQFLVSELKPFIDTTYSTDPACNYIGGSSMGGLISWYALCEYPDIFTGTACLSTHWTGLFRQDHNPLPARFQAYLDNHLPKPEKHRFYFDHGTEDLDRLYGPFQEQIDQLAQKKGYTESLWQSQFFPGTGHAESDWRDRLHIPLTFLLGK